MTSLREAREKLMEKREIKQAQAQERIKHRNLDEKERFNHLIERQKQLIDLSKQVRDA